MKKKKILISICLCGVCLIMAGCGAKQSASTDIKANQAVESYAVNVGQETLEMLAEGKQASDALNVGENILTGVKDAIKN